MQRPKDKSLPGTYEDEKSPGGPEPAREKQALKLEMQEAGYDVGPSKPVTGSEKNAARINTQLTTYSGCCVENRFSGARQTQRPIKRKF